MTNYGDMFGTPTQTKVQTPALDIPLGNPVVQNTSMVVVQKPQVPSKLEERGRSSTSKLNSINEQLLAKVKTADTGGLGKGVTDILSLTATVDMSKIDNEDPGLLGKITNMFKQTKVKILAQYEDVNQQVGRIATHMQGELKAIEVENGQLETMYQENLKEVQQLRIDVADLQDLLVKQTQYVEYLKSVNDQTMEASNKINDETQVLIRLEKHIDRLERMIQIGIMDAPDIRSQQKNNFDTAESFNDLIEFTLPMWKRQLVSALQAARQLKRAELGNAIADRNNELMRKRADMMHSASIKTAQLSQRSSIADTDTLEYAQTKLIDRLNQCKQIEQQGRAKRQEDAKKIAANREQLRLEMQSWSTNP